MKILGINIGHDSGATLLEDSKFTAINEERLSRIKMHHGFPYLAIDEVLSIHSSDMKDIDAVAIEGKRIMPQFDVGFDDKEGDWKKKVLNALGLESFLLGTETGLGIVRTLLTFQVRKVKKEIETYFRKKGYSGPFSYVDHHYAHAASAYYSQSRDEGLAITLDASGEGYCSKVYRCKNNRMELLHQIPCFHSPAYYYAYVTKILGFKPLRHEGKITGLAAFGNPKETARVFSRYIYFDKNKMSFVNKGGYHLKAMESLKKDLSSFSKEDIAAGIQWHTEQIVCEYISAIIAKFIGASTTSVFLAGGIFANVKVNQRILELENVSSIFIFPNMGDGGLNMGAAQTVAFERDPSKSKIILENVYAGRNFSDNDIEKELRQQQASFIKSQNIASDIALCVSQGKVVARFNGAMEYGPRALGNRSIVYSAADSSVNQWLNQRLNRTEFMPFAPFVRDEDYHEYFLISEKDVVPFKFMTITCDVTPKCKKEAPAITHVDGTARPQIIFRDQNPTYYDILTEFKKITGVGVLVNTSFNMHEEPIINTPGEAIATFRTGGLDVLAIGSYLLFANASDIPDHLKTHTTDASGMTLS
jgi:carbamoyltransferase